MEKGRICCHTFPRSPAPPGLWSNLPLPEGARWCFYFSLVTSLPTAQGTPRTSKLATLVSSREEKEERMKRPLEVWVCAREQGWPYKPLDTMFHLARHNISQKGHYWPSE